MCRSMADIHSAIAEIKRGKNKEKRNRTKIKCPHLLRRTAINRRQQEIQTCYRVHAVGYHAKRTLRPEIEVPKSHQFIHHCARCDITRSPSWPETDLGMFSRTGAPTNKGPHNMTWAENNHVITKFSVNVG